MSERTVSSFDPDAEWSGEPAVDDADAWTDPFWEEEQEQGWVDPSDEGLDGPPVDTPAARADWAYGHAVEPATPTRVLEAVADDLVRWDLDALLADVHDGIGERPDPSPRDRPEVVVLRSLLRHANRPEDLAARLVSGWLQDTTRSPWPLVVALAADEPVPEDDVVTAVTEACDAARTDVPPAWSLLVVALGWSRPDAPAVRDLLALVPFPHEQPATLWTDAHREAKGLPGEVHDRAGAGAEALGWDGVRLPRLAEEVAASLHGADRRSRSSSFADRIELCSHGPVVLTPTGVTLPPDTRGEKPYVALLVGSHPVFRLKRDWPERDFASETIAWSWSGPRVLETRGLGCDACREEPDKGKALFVTDGTTVARVRVRRVQQVVDRLTDEQAAG